MSPRLSLETLRAMERHRKVALQLAQGICSVLDDAAPSHQASIGPAVVELAEAMSVVATLHEHLSKEIMAAAMQYNPMEEQR